MTLQHCSEVIEDFEDAFENEKYCDVIIKTGEDPDIKELRANSFVLRVRCSYFERAFSNDWEEKDDDGNYVFKKPNIAPEVFQLILRQVNNNVSIISLYLFIIFPNLNIPINRTFSLLGICIQGL